MANNGLVSSWKVWIGVVLVGISGGVASLAYLTMGHSTPARADEAGSKVKAIAVTFTHPIKGILERRSTQPGTIQAYESVQLYAKVPGFLKKQNVDIGDHVKKGDVLAVVDVPEIESQVKRNEAAVDQANAKLNQMIARVDSAEAERDAAKAAVTRAAAAANSAAAWVRYRRLQLSRMQALFASNSIEEKLVDEAKEHFEASVETELSAKETITANRAKVSASMAKIKEAIADVEEARAEIKLNQAELKRAQVQLSFATVTAPFDGVIVQRNLYEGDFVRSANEGGSHEPLLTLRKMDLMRVVVQIPDRDVPYCDKGDLAYVEIEALPEKRPLLARISRIAQSEDANTRLMHIEIDLPNPTGKICHGMYGKVTIVLDKSSNQLSIPSSCLVGKSEDGVGSVYVIRDNKAHLIQVHVGIDNGLRVAVVDGLTAGDKVVVQPGNALSEGAVVNPTELTGAPGKAHADH